MERKDAKMINWNEVLKVADQMGIKYEKNSETPGLFVTENGVKRKITVDELFKDWTPIE
jgi:hypothetical protein